MEEKIFDGYKCMFLPVGMKLSAITSFKHHGGIRQIMVDNNTEFIVAVSWDEVAKHFMPYTELLEYFMSEDVRLVDYCWLTDSLEANGVIHEQEYLLKPIPGTFTNVRILVERRIETRTTAMTNPDSGKYFKSLLKRYEEDVAAEMKEEKRRSCCTKGRKKRERASAATGAAVKRFKALATETTCPSRPPTP